MNRCNYTTSNTIYTYLIHLYLYLYRAYLQKCEYLEILHYSLENMCNFTVLIKYISITNNLNYSYKYKNVYIVIHICISFVTLTIITFVIIQLYLYLYFGTLTLIGVIIQS